MSNKDRELQDGRERKRERYSTEHSIYRERFSEKVIEMAAENKRVRFNLKIILVFLQTASHATVAFIA